ncbi:hypothetical protein ACNHKD_12935 [Methylocystis sp. JAN1]|uniref:hypothetical protein n=1 Tax=Methylocystis sp. JAN1 TaxID=3397211 RepID=UPI003FA1D562
MTAIGVIPQTARPAPTDAELLALDFLTEASSLLCGQSAALLAAAAAGDKEAVEARLGACRRIVKEACGAWREAVPALPTREAA